MDNTTQLEIQNVTINPDTTIDQNQVVILDKPVGPRVVQRTALNNLGIFDETNRLIEGPQTNKPSDKPLEKLETSKYVVLGNVDAGKSSFIGVMTKNVLDDGNGYARSLITKLKHEQETGRTSTHAFHYMVNPNNSITTLIDLCGHEKYLKTTIFGVMGLFCDYGILLIGSNMGICEMTKEHMGLLISNRIPFITVLTKIDICPQPVMLDLKKRLNLIAKKNNKEVVYFEEAERDLKPAHSIIIDSFHERKTSIMPVVLVSNKTGHNIHFVRQLITNIHSQSYLARSMSVPKEQSTTYPAVMYVDNTFSVTGIGMVLSGTVKFGTLSVGQRVFVGPVNNTYIGVVIKSMHNCISELVSVLKPDESGSVGIRLESKGSYTRDMFSKGQIITPDQDFAMKNTTYTINCSVAVFNHPTTIRNGYQTVVHCGTIRQTAKFKMAEEQLLRTNSKENVIIKFTQRPEFILPSTLFMFRDGRTKGMGRVISTVPFQEDTPEKITRMRRGRKRSDRKKEREAKREASIDTAIPVTV